MKHIRRMLLSHTREPFVKPAIATGGINDGSKVGTGAGRVRNLNIALRGRPQEFAHRTEGPLPGRVKMLVQSRLLQEINLSVLLTLGDDEKIEHLLNQAISLFVEEVQVPLNAAEKKAIASEILNDILGLGPLEPLFESDDINDILVNGPRSVWIERNGRLEQTSIKFRDEEHLLHVINRIVAPLGRRVDESSPMVDARLPDGSRVNAVVPPLAQDGPMLSIRRFGSARYSLADLVRLGTLSEQASEFLERAVGARMNILVSGGTSAGKTTLLNVLSGYISNRERIVTIEDTSEMRLQQTHVLRMESRPDNAEGRGAISQRELVKNSLRMRPDRIIVGEVRGAEALDMLQAMNTGHDGSMTTLHANSAKDAIARLETMVLLSGIDLNQTSIREQIGSAFHLIIHIRRLADGSRKVGSISEVTGMDGPVVRLSELFTFQQSAISEDGRIAGKLEATGVPTCNARRFEDSGIVCPASLFEKGD